ncbi:cAMP-dependent kinase inhibitor gamma [Pelobates cultripes]|uniref:cAMP-dependent kinase inhibitor gamma n=1 Tax=Pelobates cultripes TaxID=61616 RepID=A0AAD1WFY7_PELCU|nr:cAMP-dependent kinase inhibitor gamma [Pelobates cultripes]
MMDVESAYTEFITCDRTGRRNAVPDIKDECTTCEGDLSENMGDLNIQESGGQERATSSDSGQDQSKKAQDGSSPS